MKKYILLIFNIVVFTMGSCQEKQGPANGGGNEDDAYTPIPRHQGTMLGANFNERIVDVIPEHLASENVEWVRVFVNVSRFINVDDNGNITGINEQLMSSYQDMQILKELSNHKVNGERIKIIFSYKYDFKRRNMGVPDIGTPEAGYIMEVSKRLLEKSNIGGDIDILVVGNEPMWETENADVNKLGLFTNYMINQVDEWRRTVPEWNYEIYAGALNRVSDFGFNNPQRNF